MTGIFLHIALTTALFYLGSRAEITRPLWSRYPHTIAKWADCAACSGFWYGAAATVGAYLADSWVLPVAWGPGAWVIGPVLGLIGTPLLAFVHQESLIHLGSALSGEFDDA